MLPPSNVNRISYDLEKYTDKHFNSDQDLTNITEDPKTIKYAKMYTNMKTVTPIEPVWKIK